MQSLWCYTGKSGCRVFGNWVLHTCSKRAYFPATRVAKDTCKSATRNKQLHTQYRRTERSLNLLDAWYLRASGKCLGVKMCHVFRYCNRYYECDKKLTDCKSTNLSSAMSVLNEGLQAIVWVSFRVSKLQLIRPREVSDSHDGVCWRFASFWILQCPLVIAADNWKDRRAFAFRVRQPNRHGGSWK